MKLLRWCSLGCVLSCAGAPPLASALTEVTRPERTVKSPGIAQVGDLALCPVQGQTFRVSADSPSAQWQGKTYFFCCEGCLEDFLRSPEAYTATSSQTR